jgi:nicotinamidase-related amidase
MEENMSKLHNIAPDPDRTVLVVIDIQERLFPAMPAEPLKRSISNACTLIEGCKVFNIPILTTEQYPKGLGATAPQIRQALGDILPIQKMAFSCCREPDFRRALDGLENKGDIILCGIETHVCVLQTALDLLQDDYHVFVAADAVCSRAKLNWQTGLDLMRHAGVTIGTTEIFLFQMLQECGTDRFRQISHLVK